MADSVPFNRQRPALRDFVQALDARDKTLVRDECDDAVIMGRHGRIYADAPNSYHLIVENVTARTWSAIRRQMVPFADLVRDGDDDGAFSLDGLPTPEQAEVIRNALSVQKRRQMSESERDRLRQMGFRPTVEEGFSAVDGDFGAIRYDHSPQPSEAEKTAPEMVPA